MPGLRRSKNSVPRPLSDKGLLLIVDYPEEWRPQIRVLLQSAARIESLPAPVRVLLLSRQPMGSLAQGHRGGRRGVAMRRL